MTERGEAFEVGASYGTAVLPEEADSIKTTLHLADVRLYADKATVIGERIIRAATALAPIAEIIRATHERYDGTGYPDGVAGESIPLTARIICVCDAYETMTSDHVYRAGVAPAEPRAELVRHAGTQFDPAVVEGFCALPADQVDLPVRRAA